MVVIVDIFDAKPRDISTRETPYLKDETKPEELRCARAVAHLASRTLNATLTTGHPSQRLRRPAKLDRRLSAASTVTIVATVTRTVPFNSVERIGLPLPALTAHDAVSQLAWRALGPRPADVHPLMQWALGGLPIDLAAGTQLTDSQLSKQVRAVAQVGRRTPLQPGVAAQLMSPTAVSPRHVRARRLFGLPNAGMPVKAPLRQCISRCMRVLAVVGPLSAAELEIAIARTHSRRSSPAPTEHMMEEALVLSGSQFNFRDSRRSAPPGSIPWPQDRALMELSEVSRTHTRQQMAALLIKAGYRGASAGKNTLDMHPLIERVGRNRYAIARSRHDS